MQATQRAEKHPILDVFSERETVDFTFNGKSMQGFKGEVISSALFANGIKTFGHHLKDGSPQGIFCANGQCSQCTVLADGVVVKACMEKLREGMNVMPYDSLANLSDLKQKFTEFKDPPILTCQVFIIGGGPSGISAGIELGKLGIDTIIIDDKHQLGGKLILQTHKFFGSREDCYAGTRGIDIAIELQKQLEALPSVKIMTDSPCIAVFEGGFFGILHPEGYKLIKPEMTIIASGAREKCLPFPGWDLPGVYGAGAFQTLMNRDLVKPCEKLFIMGGGNVGLIAAYHAMQAGITVCGLTEIMPKTGGYEVHSSKIKRLGVPIYLNHTVVSCEGDAYGLKKVNICKVDKDYKKIEGSIKKIEADTLLIAVGLNPVDELYTQAKQLGIAIDTCGDAEEIAEASAAMFSGKITGLKTAQKFGFKVEISADLDKKCEILKSRPGEVHNVQYPDYSENINPVIHCFEEIPCNPCSEVCPHKSFKLKDENNIMSIPVFSGKCSGCFKCLLICPGLAITLMDTRNMPENKAKVTIPYELSDDLINEGQLLAVTNHDGKVIGKGVIEKIIKNNNFDKRILITVITDRKIAGITAGFRLPEFTENEAEPSYGSVPEYLNDLEIVCRCERVTAGSIRKAIKEGAGALSEIKTILRCTMGPCSGKTCASLISKILKAEGIDPEKMSLRPLDMEIPIGVLAGGKL